MLNRMLSGTPQKRSRDHGAPQQLHIVGAEQWQGSKGSSRVLWATAHPPTGTSTRRAGTVCCLHTRRRNNRLRRTNRYWSRQGNREIKVRQGSRNLWNTSRTPEGRWIPYCTMADQDLPVCLANWTDAIRLEKGNYPAIVQRKRQQKGVQELQRHYPTVYTRQSLRSYPPGTDKDEVIRSSAPRAKRLHPSQVNCRQDCHAQHTSADTRGVQQATVDCICWLKVSLWLHWVSHFGCSCITMAFLIS